MKTIEEGIKYFKNELAESYDDKELQQIIDITFCYYLNLTKVDLLIDKAKSISESQKQKILGVIEELKNHKPLAYILGEWEFYGLPFKVNKHTLIPRPETEELVELILKENKEGGSIIDIGTGTGCIPIALKTNNSKYNVFAVDISEEAIKIAKENALLNNVIVDFSVYDIIKNRNNELTNKFDTIVSNPPYIPQKEKTLMSKNVLDFEPELALFVDNEEPLIFYEAIADFAQLNLADNGKLYFEINENYGDEVCDMLKNKAFKNINIVKDINDKDRIVKCQI